MIEIKDKNIMLSGIVIVGLILIALMVKGCDDRLGEPYLGFKVNADSTVTMVDAGSPAAKAGLRIDDRILKINGAPVRNRDAITHFGRMFMPGYKLEYDILRNDREHLTVEVTCGILPPAQKRKIVFNAITAFIVLVIALHSVLRKPHRRLPRVFFYLCAVYIFFRMPHPRWRYETVAMIYQNLYLFIFFLCPAVFLHFCSRFPRMNAFLHRKPRRLIWLYAFPVILAIPAMVANWLHHADVRTNRIVTQMIVYQGAVIWLVYLVLGVLLMMKGYIQLRSRAMARRCSLVFYALFLAVLPYLLIGFFDAFKVRISLLESMIPMILFIPFPLSLAWAIDLEEIVGNEHDGFGLDRRKN